MDGIRKKQDRSQLSPDRDFVHNNSNTPIQRPAILPVETRDRISNSPFFDNSNSPTPPMRTKPSVKNNSLLWGLAFISLLIVALMAATSYFSSASIEVVPVTEKAVLDHEFTATKSAQDDQLVFHFMNLNEEKTQEVSATIEKSILKKASGKVIIYNKYSKDPQRLIKNTRLEATGGKVFRIDDSVVVPGTRIINGKVELGQVEATVYADAAGKEYNLGVVDFTIPGFKGDPRYTKFFARSVTDSPLAGGFSGTIKVPRDEDVVNAQLALKEDLKKSLLEKAQSQIPEGVTFFPGSVILKYEDVPQDLTEEEQKKVIVRATISVFFFDTASITKKMAEVALKNYKNTPQSISNLPTLIFSFVEPVDNIVLSDVETIRFKITGEAVFVGDIDKDKLIGDLAGKKNSEFSNVIEKQINIRKANGEIFPKWNTSFPEDPKNISVKIINDN